MLRCGLVASRCRSWGSSGFRSFPSSEEAAYVLSHRRHTLRSFPLVASWSVSPLPLPSCRSPPQGGSTPRPCLRRIRCVPRAFPRCWLDTSLGFWVQAVCLGHVTLLLRRRTGEPALGRLRVSREDESTRLFLCSPCATSAAAGCASSLCPKERCGAVACMRLPLLSEPKPIKVGSVWSLGPQPSTRHQKMVCPRPRICSSHAPRREPFQASSLAPRPAIEAVVPSVVQARSPDDRSSSRYRPRAHCCVLGVFRASWRRSAWSFERSPSEDGSRLVPW